MVPQFIALVRNDVAVSHDPEKRAAASAAAHLPTHGMRLGLGTGSTVAFLLSPLAERQLDLVCVATSPATEIQAVGLGMDVRPFEGGEALGELDLAIDGADQVAPDGWIVKGAGGAQVREKIVAAAARRFVVIVSEDKLVDHITVPVPVELLSFGLAATMRALGDVRIRPGTPPSPDGGVIADWFGEVGDPGGAAAFLDGVPGVVGHGLFPPSMTSEVIVGLRSGGTRTISVA